MTDTKVTAPPGSPSKVKKEEAPDASTKRKVEETTATSDATNPPKAIKTEDTATPGKAAIKTETTNGVKKEGTTTEATDLTKIRDLVDFYFGDANFRRDKFMQTEAEKSPEGFVKISVLLTFNKLKNITTDESVVASAVGEGTSIVKLSDDKTSIKRINPLTGEDDSYLRTIFVENLPKIPAEGHKDVSVDEMVNLFKKVGDVSYVRLSRDRTTKKLTGVAFVEFKTTEEVNKVLAHGMKENVTLAGKEVKLKIRKFDKDHKEKVAQRAAANKKRKAEDEGGEGGDAATEGGEGETKEPKVYDFDIEENFEAELKTLIPRHVKFSGIKKNTPYYELRDFLNQYGEVKYVTQDSEAGVALVKFLTPEAAGKFLGESPEIKDVVFQEHKLTITPATEDEVRVQLKAKNDRKRANLEGRSIGKGGRGRGRGGGGRGRGGGGRGRGSKRGRKN